jgi:hypothetical protein
VVTNDTQGAQLATLQTLARRWGTAYDWRRCEARLNAVPQFLTAIDGIDIHFIQVRSHHGLDVNRQCAAKGQLRPHFPGRGARTIRLH